MELTVVIVNYRVKFFLEQTLASVHEATRGIDASVVVVDNNSGDDSITHCRQRFPGVAFVENNENVGFSKANNQAIMAAESDYTLILNPDTIITHKALAQCIEWMHSHSECGAIGVRMVDGNGVFLPESKRAFPTPWVSFCKIFGLSKLFPRSRVFARYHMRFLSDRESHKVDILSGAFMFCRTSLLQQIGGFDEDFFMYGEDIDLSYRICQAGFDNWFLPVHIIHYKGESTKKDSMRYVKVFYDAMLIFYRKHFPRSRALLYPFIKLGVGVRRAMAIVRRLFKRKKTDSGFSNAPWVVKSKNAAEVAQKAGINEYVTQLPQKGRANVLLDNASYSYQEIVELIAGHSRRGVEFHIFSHQNNIIISPKMKQQ